MDKKYAEISKNFPHCSKENALYFSLKRTAAAETDDVQCCLAAVCKI